MEQACLDERHRDGDGLEAFCDQGHVPAVIAQAVVGAHHRILQVLYVRLAGVQDAREKLLLSRLPSNKAVVAGQEAHETTGLRLGVTIGGGGGSESKK